MTPQTVAPPPPRLLFPWDSPGKNTGVDCHFLLHAIFPTQGWNPRLLYWQADSLPLSHLGNNTLVRSALICVRHCCAGWWFVTVHLLVGPWHHVVLMFSHLVKLLSLLFYRITLYDYQAMCRANKESSDSAHGLLDVSTVQSLRRQMSVSSCLGV